MCESAHEILAPASDRGGRVSKGDKGKRAIGLQQPHEEEQNDFVLGDSDDEMEQDDLAPPPGIDDNEEEHHHATAPPAYDGPSTGDAVDEKRTREQNGIHYLQKSDTLVGLAMQYKVEVSDRAASQLLRSSLLTLFGFTCIGSTPLFAEQTSALHSFNNAPPPPHPSLPSPPSHGLLHFTNSTPPTRSRTSTSNRPTFPNARQM